MDFLYQIIAIIVVAITVIILIQLYPSVMTSWVFWVAVSLMAITFVGVPSLAVKMFTRNA